MKISLSVICSAAAGIYMFGNTNPIYWGLAAAVFMGLESGLFKNMVLWVPAVTMIAGLVCTLLGITGNTAGLLMVMLTVAAVLMIKDELDHGQGPEKGQQSSRQAGKVSVR